MTGIQSSANPQTKDEARLRALYGDKLPRSRLLHGQLQERIFFDSGDHALSKAHKPTNIGEVETGTEHPMRTNISHPVSAMPASSNVSGAVNDANMFNRRRSTEVTNKSSLHEQVAQAETPKQDASK